MGESKKQPEYVSEQEHNVGNSACSEGLTGSRSGQAKDEPSCSSFPLYSSKELGRKGEEAAVRFLERRGFEIIETNWTCFAGEADIIARDGDVLCFIEVKTRAQTRKGFPEEAIDARKRDKYERIAACFLKTYDACDIRVRFDVISILVLSEHRAFLRFHTNAFGAE